MASKVPPSLKGIGSYVKIANENATRDPVVYYWCLFYSVQHGMQLDKKSPDALQFITSLLGTLEVVKKQLAGNEAITNEVVAQAHLENFAWKLFKYADDREKTGNVDKSVVHAFLTAGHVFDVLALFGEVEEPVASTKKYAKWKCMQINECLKNGTPYVPSGQQVQEQNEDDELLKELTSFGAPTQPQNPVPPSYDDLHNFEQNYGGPQHQNFPPIPSHSNVPNLNVPGQQPNYGFSAPATPAAPPAISRPPAPNYGSHAPASAPAHLPPPTTNQFIPPAATGAKKDPSVEEFTEAKKYIKYAMSACDFEDTKTVVDNLRKALRLMGEA